MPKVQEYGGLKVTQQNVKGPRASAVDPDAFGGPVARGIGDLGRGIVEFGKRRDITEAESNMLEFERAKNKMFFDPDTGYFNTQGRDAFDGAEPTTKQLDDLRRQYSEKLSTQGARQAFDKVAQAHITRGRVDIMQHASKGMLSWEVATIEAQAENSIEAGSLYFNNPDKLALNHELGREAVVEAAKLKGLDGDVLNENLQSFTSSFYTSAIGTGIDKSYGQGKALLDAHRSKLEGPDLRKLESALASKLKSTETESRAGQAIAKSREIYAQATDLSDAMAMAEKIEDPRMYKAVRGELRARYGQDKQDEQYAQAEAWDTAEEHIIEGGGNALTFQQENPELFNRLSTQQRAKLESGELTQTDPIILTNIKMMSLDELKGINLNDYSQSLSLADRKVIQKLKTDAIEGKFDASLQTEAAEFKTFALQYFDKKSESDMSTQNLEEMNVMRQYVENRLADYKAQNKTTNVPREEYRKIMNELLFKTSEVVPKSFALDKKVTFEMIPNEASDGSPLMPVIRQHVIDSGFEPTAQNIVTFWSKNYTALGFDSPY